MFGVPHSKFGQFWFFFVTQFVAYFVIVANTRAYTQGNYLWTGITDAFFAAQNFIMIRVIAKEDYKKGFWAGLGYTMGWDCWLPNLDLGDEAHLWHVKNRRSIELKTSSKCARRR